MNQFIIFTQIDGVSQHFEAQKIIAGYETGPRRSEFTGLTNTDVIYLGQSKKEVLSNLQEAILLDSIL